MPINLERILAVLSAEERELVEQQAKTAYDRTMAVFLPPPAAESSTAASKLNIKEFEAYWKNISDADVRAALKVLLRDLFDVTLPVAIARDNHFKFSPGMVVVPITAESQHDYALDIPCEITGSDRAYRFGTNSIGNHLPNGLDAYRAPSLYECRTHFALKVITTTPA